MSQSVHMKKGPCALLDTDHFLRSIECIKLVNRCSRMRSLGIHDTIPSLQHATVGFDLLSGTRFEQAKKLADMLNEYVVDVFVTVANKGATA